MAAYPEKDIYAPVADEWAEVYVLAKQGRKTRDLLFDAHKDKTFGHDRPKTRASNYFNDVYWRVTTKYNRRGTPECARNVLSRLRLLHRALGARVDGRTVAVPWHRKCGQERKLEMARKLAEYGTDESHVLCAHCVVHTLWRQPFHLAIIDRHDTTRQLSDGNCVCHELRLAVAAAHRRLETHDGRVGLGRLAWRRRRALNALLGARAFDALTVALAMTLQQYRARKQDVLREWSLCDAVRNHVIALDPTHRDAAPNHAAPYAWLRSAPCVEALRARLAGVDLIDSVYALDQASGAAACAYVACIDMRGAARRRFFFYVGKTDMTIARRFFDDPASHYTRACAATDQARVSIPSFDRALARSIIQPAICVVVCALRAPAGTPLRDYESHLIERLGTRYTMIGLNEQT